MWHPEQRASIFIKALNRGMCMCVAVYIWCDLFLSSKIIPKFRQTILYSTMYTLTINLKDKLESVKKNIFK